MIPRYGEWDQKYAGRGLRVVGVHTPETEPEVEPQAITAFVRAKHIRWPVVLDPYAEAWKRYLIDAWPTALLIDRRGVVRATFVGDDRAADIEETLQRLLAEP